MKSKVKFLLLLVLLLVPSFVLAKDTCNDNDIKIKSITLKELNGFSEEVEESTINNNTIKLNLKMYDVGDSSTYDITVENISNEDYYFTKDSMKLENNYLEYSLKNDSEVISANSTKTIELKVSYKNQIPDNNYSDTSKLIISLSDKPLENPKTKMSYTFILMLISLIMITIFIKMNNKPFNKKKLLLIVASLSIIPLTTTALCTVNLNIETKIEIENKEAIFLPGSEVNIKMKELAGDDTSSVTTPYAFSDTNIISIKYSEFEPIAANKEEKNIVSTPDSPYPIYMWFEDGTIYWWSEDIHPNLNEDSSNMFRSLTHLNDISGVKNYDASNIKNIQYMFGRTSLISLVDLKSWDTSNINNMSYAFYVCRQLESTSGLETWNTSNVEDMKGLFYTDIKLKDLTAIKNWDVRKVKYMQSMFSTCFSIEEIDLSNWETSSLENMQDMFAQLWINIDGQPTTGGVLKTIKLSEKFDTSKVTNMDGTFYNNRVIENYEFLKYLDTSNVENMFQMFFSNYGLTNTEYVKKWNVSNVKYMSGLFIGTKNLASLEGLKNWDTSGATDIAFMFRNCTSLTSLSGMENWDVSKVIDFSYIFDGATSLSNTSSINDWSISSTAIFTRMFGGTKSHPEFTKVQGTWDSAGTFTPTP